VVEGYHPPVRAYVPDRSARVKRAMDLLRNAVGQMPQLAMDLPCWVWHLKRQFELNDIAEDIKLTLLNQLLNDKARKLMSKLPAETINDFDALLKALMTEFQLTPHRYREEFLSLRKKVDETFSQLASRIEIYFKYYLESRTVELNAGNRRMFDLIISNKIRTVCLKLITRSLETRNWRTGCQHRILGECWICLLQTRSHRRGLVVDSEIRGQHSREAQVLYLDQQSTNDPLDLALSLSHMPEETDLIHKVPSIPDSSIQVGMIIGKILDKILVKKTEGVKVNIFLVIAWDLRIQGIVILVSRSQRRRIVRQAGEGVNLTGGDLK